MLNGLRFRQSLRTGDKAEAEIIAAKIYSDALLGKLTGKLPELTVSQALARYYSEHGQYLRSASDMLRWGEELQDGLGRKTLLSELRAPALATYAARRRLGLANRSVNIELQHLRAVINQARDVWEAAVATAHPAPQGPMARACGWSRVGTRLPTTTANDRRRASGSRGALREGEPRAADDRLADDDLGLAARPRAARRPHQGKPGARRQMIIRDAVAVAIHPAPPVVAGTLSPADHQAVFQWVAMNEAALIDYWDFRIDTDEFLQRLRPISPPIPP
jgi:hypothetical protein